MTCALPDGVVLHFLESGIRINPMDVDIRAEQRNYMHGQVVVSREAGEVIKENMAEAEPAWLEFDGNPSQRFYIPQDAVEFFTEYNDNPRARVDLYDARKVLTRGSLDTNYTSVSLSKVVDKIINEYRDDPSNVITGVNYTDEVDQDEIREDYERLQSGTEGTAGQIRYTQQLFNSFLENQFSNLEANPDHVYSGFEFDGVTPLQAMEEVMAEFEHEWWIDREGVLQIGTDGTFGNVIATASDSPGIRIERYDVVESATKTNRVWVEAPVTSTIDSSEYPVIDPETKTRLRNVAIASAPNMEGDVEKLENKKATSQGELRRAASRFLYGEIMNDTNGSIVINGMASDNTPSISKLQPGDHVVIDRSVAEECREDVISGHFLVNSVSHNASPREGWKITLRVSQVVPDEELDVQSFYYDPTTGDRYTDLDVLKSDVPYVGSP